MPWPVVFQKLKIKIEISGRKRKTISHIVAGAIEYGYGKARLTAVFALDLVFATHHRRAADQPARRGFGNFRVAL